LGPVCQSIFFRWQRESKSDGLDLKNEAAALFSEIKSLNIDQSEKTKILNSSFESLSSNLPSLAWSLLKDGDAQLQASALDSKERIASGMVANNAEAAFKELTTYAGEGRLQLIEAASYALSKRDMKKAPEILNVMSASVCRPGSH
jgi:hypothetical protein